MLPQPVPTAGHRPPTRYSNTQAPRSMLLIYATQILFRASSLLSYRHTTNLLLSYIYFNLHKPHSFVNIKRITFLKCIFKNLVLSTLRLLLLAIFTLQ